MHDTTKKQKTLTQAAVKIHKHTVRWIYRYDTEYLEVLGGFAAVLMGVALAVTHLGLVHSLTYNLLKAAIGPTTAAMAPMFLGGGMLQLWARDEKTWKIPVNLGMGLVWWFLALATAVATNGLFGTVAMAMIGCECFLIYIKAFAGKLFLLEHDRGR